LWSRIDSLGNISDRSGISDEPAVTRVARAGLRGIQEIDAENTRANTICFSLGAILARACGCLL